MTSTAPSPLAPTLPTSSPWRGPAGGKAGAGQGGRQPPPRLCRSPTSSTPFRSQGDAAGDGVFPGKESLAAFFGWLDYLDELVMGAHPVRSDRPALQSMAAPCPCRGSASAITHRSWQMPSPRPWRKSFSRASCSHSSWRCECLRHKTAARGEFLYQGPPWGRDRGVALACTSFFPTVRCCGAVSGHPS